MQQHRKGQVAGKPRTRPHRVPTRPAPVDTGVGAPNAAQLAPHSEPEFQPANLPLEAPRNRLPDFPSLSPLGDLFTGSLDELVAMIIPADLPDGRPGIPHPAVVAFIIERLIDLLDSITDTDTDQDEDGMAVEWCRAVNADGNSRMLSLGDRDDSESDYDNEPDGCDDIPAHMERAAIAGGKAVLTLGPAGQEMVLRRAVIPVRRFA